MGSPVSEVGMGRTDHAGAYGFTHNDVDLRHTIA